MRALILPVGLRLSACGYCSYHFTHMEYPINLQEDIQVIFIVYQLVKMVYYFTSDRFEEEAQRILHWLHWIFLAIVIAGCAIDFFSTIGHTNDVYQIIGHALACLIKVLIYIAIEFLTEFFYALKVSRQNQGNPDEKVTFGGTIKRFLGISAKNSAETVSRQPEENKSAKTASNRKQKRRQEKFRKPVKSSQHEILSKLFQERRNKGKKK